MTLDYFYGAQADLFTFYRIPKALFTEERFKPISAEAKILYGILLDRMSLSQRNGWLDEENRVFIIFTLDEVMDAIGCAERIWMRDSAIGNCLREIWNITFSCRTTNTIKTPLRRLWS